MKDDKDNDDSFTLRKSSITPGLIFLAILPFIVFPVLIPILLAMLIIAGITIGLGVNIFDSIKRNPYGATAALGLLIVSTYLFNLNSSQYSTENKREKRIKNESKNEVTLMSNLPTLKKQCSNKKMNKCYEIGILYQENHHKNWSKGRDCGEKRGCSKAVPFRQHLNCGSQKGCRDFWKNYDISLNKSFKYFKKSCDLGHPRGCHSCGSQLSSLKAFSSWTKKERAMSLSCFQKACSLKYYNSCADLGFYYQGKRERRKAKLYFNKGCSLGDKISCTMLNTI